MVNYRLVRCNLASPSFVNPVKREQSKAMAIDYTSKLNISTSIQGFVEIV